MVGEGSNAGVVEAALRLVVEVAETDVENVVGESDEVSESLFEVLSVVLSVVLSKSCAADSRKGENKMVDSIIAGVP